MFLCLGWVELGNGRIRTRRNSFVPPLPVVPSSSEALQLYSAVVVTGGSSGIGKSFINLGAKLKPDLVFCNLSRRPPEGVSVSPSGIRLNHFACDLSCAADVDRVATEVGAWLERNVPAGRILLINNSGFGSFGRFSELNLSRELEMIDLNTRAVVHLTGRLLPLLRARGGTVMNIASVMAFQPTPYAASYGATKAFLLHWTLALNEELRGSQVRAIAVCPGTTATDFFRRAGLGAGAIIPALSMTPDAVVLAALRALAAGQSQVVPGWKNKIYTVVGAVMPKRLAAWMGAKILARFRLGKART
ncbi:MAG: SDR family NAD(P)-dependent oxidoreductase [Opitutus sp.]|nr:SDR family NAD(P)-dependent oxidoreductase [Opitutus sp.]